MTSEESGAPGQQRPPPPHPAPHPPPAAACPACPRSLPHQARGGRRAGHSLRTVGCGYRRHWQRRWRGVRASDPAARHSRSSLAPAAFCSPGRGPRDAALTFPSGSCSCPPPRHVTTPGSPLPCRLQGLRGRLQGLRGLHGLAWPGPTCNPASPTAPVLPRVLEPLSYLTHAAPALQARSLKPGRVQGRAAAEPSAWS